VGTRSFVLQKMTNVGAPRRSLQCVLQSTQCDNDANICDCVIGGKWNSKQLPVHGRHIYMQCWCRTTARCYVSPKPAADIHKDKSCLPALQPPHNGFGGSYQKHGQKTRNLEHAYPSHVTNRCICLEILAS